MKSFKEFNKKKLFEGYTTDFDGVLTLTPAATQNQIDYINRFSGSRRMMRNPQILRELYNGEYGLDDQEYGVDGEYFANPGRNYGQNEDRSIIDYNRPPRTQPSLWCQWILSDDGQTLMWDGGEKFYSYIDWLNYMIENFFQKWGIKLNGNIEWQGEDYDDTGYINVKNNNILINKEFDNDEDDDEFELDFD